MTLEEVEDGTLLTLVHSDVPEGQTSYEQGGWQEHYFEPMKEYFATRKRGGVTAAAPNRRLKRVAAGTKSKRAAPKARAAAGKKTPKRAIAAKAKSKRARKTKSKSTGGRRRR